MYRFDSSIPFGSEASSYFTVSVRAGLKLEFDGPISYAAMILVFEGAVGGDCAALAVSEPPSRSSTVFAWKLSIRLLSALLTVLAFWSTAPDSLTLMLPACPRMEVEMVTVDVGVGVDGGCGSSVGDGAGGGGGGGAGGAGGGGVEPVPAVRSSLVTAPELSV